MSPGSALKKQQASPLAAAALSAAAGSSGLAAGAGTFLPCSPPAQRPHSRRHAPRCNATELHLNGVYETLVCIPA